jgi:hypothetical protein
VWIFSVLFSLLGSYAISITSFGSILLGCLCGYGTDQCSFSLDFVARGLPALPVEAIRRVDALRSIGGPSWLRDSEWHALAHTGVDRNEHCSRKWSWEYGDSPPSVVVGRACALSRGVNYSAAMRCN